MLSSNLAWLAQGSAAFLLERYEEAEAALLEGLSLEPGSAELQAALRAVRQALDDSQRQASPAAAAAAPQQQQQGAQGNGRWVSTGLRSKSVSRAGGLQWLHMLSCVCISTR
jgi:hypothetical protein